MLLTRRLRNLPITAVRFVRAVKYFFAEHIKVPHDVELRQVIAILQDITKPLLGTKELKEGGFSPNFIQNLLRSMAGLRVHKLQPWFLSSAYIFVYFVISRHKNDSICMQAYDYMLKGETPTFKVIEHIVNNIIFKCDNLNVTNNKNCEGLTQNQIHNFRKILQKDCCQNELQVLVAWPEDLGLICSNNDHDNMETEMLHYFKLFEINCSTTDAVDKLNILENKGTTEGSSVNNFSNLIEDNINSTCLKKSKNIDNNLENCSLQDKNQFENITKRILRPRINASNGRITRSKKLSNENREPKPISRDLKEKAGTLSNDVDTNLASSKNTNRKPLETLLPGSTLSKESITVVDLDFESTNLNLKRLNQSPQEFPTLKKMCFESRSNSCAVDFPTPIATASSNLTATNNNSDPTLKRKSITVIDLDLESCMFDSDTMSHPLQDPSNVKTICSDTTFKNSATDYPVPASSSSKKKVTTNLENPDLEIVEIRKNTFIRSISEIKMSNNTASMPTLTPGPFAILFANRDLRKCSKGKTAANQKRSQLRQNTVDYLPRRSIPVDYQSKKASINEPVNGLISTSDQKATPTVQASLTEMNEVNPVDQSTSSQSQQYPLQDQQQHCLFASCQEVNYDTFSSSFNKDSSKLQLNVQQNTITTNVGGNFLVQTGSLPLNPRLTSSTVFDRPISFQLAEKNKNSSSYQEDILQPTHSANMSTVSDQFPLNQAHPLLTTMRPMPLQQLNFQFNEKRFPTHYSDVQHYTLVNNTSGLHNCLPAQQQQQSMRYVFNSAAANSMGAEAEHGVNEVLTPDSEFLKAPVNLGNLHYFCDYCPIQLKFDSAELLYQHVNDAHNYSCRLCKNRYPTRQAFLQHMDMHTGNNSAK